MYSDICAAIRPLFETELLKLNGALLNAVATRDWDLYSGELMLTMTMMMDPSDSLSLCSSLRPESLVPRPRHAPLAGTRPRAAAVPLPRPFFLVQFSVCDAQSSRPRHGQSSRRFLPQTLQCKPPLSASSLLAHGRLIGWKRRGRESRVAAGRGQLEELPHPHLRSQPRQLVVE